MGFFGLYSVTLQALPGLPAIELAQFYILLSFIKALKKRKQYPIFFSKYLQVLLLYLFFSVFWGQLMGFTGGLQGYFRILKGTMPLLLFYSVPRLFPDISSYIKFFQIVFIVFLLGFLTQIFSLITGISPQMKVLLTEEQLFEAGRYREFLNISYSLLALFASLFFLILKKPFNHVYLISIIFSCFGMAFLSATRGWIIGFGVAIALSLIVTIRIYSKRFIGFLIVSVILIITGISYPKIQYQVDFSLNRFGTLESLMEGDLTADETLGRLSERSPKVMGKWKENPVFGWGMSDITREFGDGHVGNQNLLLTSGLLGFALLYGFFIFFITKIIIVYIKLNRHPEKYSYLVFIFFLIGWLIIHSTSGQYFAYGGLPLRIIPQTVFFNFAALMYSESKMLKYV